MKVLRIDSGSEAARAGIRTGDDLIEIDGHAIGDGIDVAHAIGWTDDDEIRVVFARDGKRMEFTLPSVHPEELGIALEPDALRTCGNHCAFCFIDQLPRGLRSSLYIKDEDYRLSFTCGNYVTLTNMSAGDYERILAQRLSPLYVSVHATDDDARRRLLGNTEAPPILPALSKLTDGGIAVHTQIVVCPGINDGDVLDATLRDLTALGDGLASIAVVPVGLTSHRDDLSELEPVSAGVARDTLAILNRWQARMLSERHEPIVYAADEFYLLAGLDPPPLEEYGDFPQLENGVGLLRWFERDIVDGAANIQGIDAGRRAVTILTGTLAAPFIETTVRRAFGGVAGLDLSVVPVVNRLLGESVTVAGLLAGRDIAEAVRGAGASDLFLLPGEAFNAEWLTLDGLALPDIRDLAGVDHIDATGDLVAAIERLLQDEAHGQTEGS
ncbi:MAG: DUF512 domain-containing protein [Deltaproteobacteria bacterium]|nr:MAG: DUF512 domain-containing protein [Deltaproteobacteria bacterium]